MDNLWAGIYTGIPRGPLRDTHAQNIMFTPVFTTVGIDRWEDATNQLEVATT